MSEAIEVSVVKPSEIIPCFTIPSHAVRQAAYEEACKMAPSLEVSTALLSILKKGGGETWKTWYTILKALSVHGKGNLEVQEALRDRLEQKEICFQIAVAETFFLVGGDVNLALDAIMPSLKATDRPTKGHAVEALISFGPSALPAVSAIADVVADEEEFESYRKKALSAICAIGPEAKVVSPQLVKALHTRNANVLASLLPTLKVIGVIKEAVPDLVEALNYKDRSTGHIRNRCPSLMFIGCGDDMHAIVCQLLGTLGKDASEAVPNLEELLRRETDFEEWKKRLDEEAEKHNAPILAEYEKELAIYEQGKKKGERRPTRPRVDYRLMRGSEKLNRIQIRLTSLEAKKFAIEAIELIKNDLRQKV